jgi:hypothetical protein
LRLGGRYRNSIRGYRNSHRSVTFTFLARTRMVTPHAARRRSLACVPRDLCYDRRRGPSGFFRARARASKTGTCHKITRFSWSIWRDSSPGCSNVHCRLNGPPLTPSVAGSKWRRRYSRSVAALGPRLSGLILTCRQGFSIRLRSRRTRHFDGKRPFRSFA